MNKFPKWKLVVVAVMVLAIIWKITYRIKLNHTVETDLFSKGQIELNNGHASSAIEIFEIFLKRDPNHIPALQFKLQAELLADKLKEAEITADKIMRLEPTYSNKYQLSEILTKNGKEAQARQIMNLPMLTPTRAPPK